jgi:hypothetical protein
MNGQTLNAVPDAEMASSVEIWQAQRALGGKLRKLRVYQASPRLLRSGDKKVSWEPGVPTEIVSPGCGKAKIQMEAITAAGLS